MRDAFIMHVFRRPSPWKKKKGLSKKKKLEELHFAQERLTSLNLVDM